MTLAEPCDLGRWGLACRVQRHSSPSRGLCAAAACPSILEGASVSTPAMAGARTPPVLALCPLGPLGALPPRPELGPVWTCFTAPADRTVLALRTAERAPCGHPRGEGLSLPGAAWAAEQTSAFLPGVSVLLSGAT